jgi:hypothetical protein
MWISLWLSSIGLMALCMVCLATYEWTARRFGQLRRMRSSKRHRPPITSAPGAGNVQALCLHTTRRVFFLSNPRSVVENVVPSPGPWPWPLSSRKAAYVPTSPLECLGCAH